MSVSHLSFSPSVSRHRLHSHRTVAVHAPNERGDADLGRVVHALHQVEVQGRRTHLIHTHAQPSQFDVAVVHPARPQWPAWVGKLGAAPAEPVLLWAADMPPATSRSFLAGMHRQRLALLGLAWLVLAVLAWLHAPAGASLGDIVASRHGGVALLLLGVAGWLEAVRHLRRLPIDLSSVHSLFRYPLADVPGSFDAPAQAQMILGDTLLRVVRGRVDEVTHWQHPGPTHPGARRQPQRRFRFQMDGRRFEGRTAAHRGSFSHPFLVPGDEVRVAVQPSGDGGWRVVALANLTDGHLVFDETDERLQTVSDASQTAMGLLGLGAAAVLALWLGAGPAADDVSLALLSSWVALALWIGAPSAWKFERRSRLARALGTVHRREQKRRRLAVTPVTMGEG
ncbi:MAG: hypothetical protein V4739_15830 [Pseudomonadota bacterium]